MEPNSVNVPLPPELARELEERAKRHGLSLPAYIGLMARVIVRQHDAEFARAARAVFSKYPDTLRKLAQ